MVGLGNVTNESKATMFTDSALTGIPTAPTAASSVNTTQIATTAYVKTAVANLIASAPSTLDTLNELFDRPVLCRKVRESVRSVLYI